MKIQITTATVSCLSFNCAMGLWLVIALKNLSLMHADLLQLEPILTSQAGPSGAFLSQPCFSDLQFCFQLLLFTFRRPTSFLQLASGSQLTSQAQAHSEFHVHNVHN
jgi:hypothetical protein